MTFELTIYLANTGLWLIDQFWLKLAILHTNGGVGSSLYTHCNSIFEICESTLERIARFNEFFYFYQNKIFPVAEVYYADFNSDIPEWVNDIMYIIIVTFIDSYLVLFLLTVLYVNLPIVASKFIEIHVLKLKKSFEHNLSNFTDFRVLVSYLLASFLTHFCDNNHYIRYSYIYVNYFNSSLFCVVFAAFILYNLGIRFISFIKGSSSFNKILLSIIFDLTSLMSFIFRILLQLSRLVLASIMVFGLCEFFFNVSYYVTFDLVDFDIYISKNFKFFYKVFHMAAEVVDASINFSAQTLIFFIVIYWLLSFLFTNINNKKKRYFFFND